MFKAETQTAESSFLDIMCVATTIVMENEVEREESDGQPFRDWFTAGVPCPAGCFAGLSGRLLGLEMEAETGSRHWMRRPPVRRGSQSGPAGLVVLLTLTTAETL